MSPRFILKVGDTIMDWCAWEFEHNGLNEAGVMHIKLPVTADKWTWWTQQTEIIVDAYIGYPLDPHNYSASDLVHMMRARIDTLEFDLGQGLITMSGRDLTSLLIDVKSDAKYPNQTASQIAQQLAQQVGLKAQVQPTTTLVGNYYSADHVLLQREETLWTLLTYLAQHEGFQCFVLGRTLYFGNFGAQSTLDPYLITVDTNGNFAQSNAKHLKLSQDLTLAQDLSVTVRSYHGQRGAAFTATATATKTAKNIERDAELAQALQHYDYTIPGLTQPECALKAQQILSELTRHELKMSAGLPFDATLFPWVPVQLVGTSTPWDATYTPQNVTRRFSKDRVSMRVEARTGIPQQTVTLA